MDANIRIEGIYDQRTLKAIKREGINCFSFDFSPKSFNFVPEHIFLEQLLVDTSEKDFIFLHFQRSNDPMINKLALDIQKNGRTLDNVFFEIEEWCNDMPPQRFAFNYLLSFAPDLDLLKLMSANFKGLTFDFKFFEELHHKNILSNFANNFFTKYHSLFNENVMMILRIDWDNNLINSLFNIFEFNMLSIQINSKIEVCYRNVDLKKLNEEMAFIKKSAALMRDF